MEFEYDLPASLTGLTTVGAGLALGTAPGSWPSCSASDSRECVGEKTAD